MEFATPEFKELLNIFNEHGVEYLIVGAFAVMIYSEPRYTKDLDIWVRTSPDNAKRVFAALRDFGAPLANITEHDFAEEGFYQMGRPPGRIDVMMSLDGVDFETAWESRTSDTFRGVPVHYIGKEDLLHNKRLAGRYQDLADIENMQSKKD
ncbi:nucleotidyl transferase AbiEii/AbiGii toxin family protein [soil metagenome]